VRRVTLQPQILLSGFNPHQHPEVAVINTSTMESDGSDVTGRTLPNFPRVLFVAMSDNKTFHYYSWEDFEAQIKK